MVPMKVRAAIGVRGTPRAPVDAPLPAGAVEVPAGTLKAWRNNPIGLFRLVVFGRLVPAAFFAWLGYQQLLRLAVDVRAHANEQHALGPHAVRRQPQPGRLRLLLASGAQRALLVVARGFYRDGFGVSQ